MKGKIFLFTASYLMLMQVSQAVRASDIVSAQSGSWTSASTWSGGVVPAQTDNVTVKNGHTITIPSSGSKSCTNLTVEAGGKLYANTGGSQRYVDIYGNITCNGIIGNGAVADGISFNTEGTACLISGSGTFDASRIRKYYGTSATTTLTIGMDVSLRYGGTAICNSKSATNYHVIVNAGCTLNCTGSGGVAGNACIDGSNGSNGSSYGGSFTVNGTLDVSGLLYLTTDNNSNLYTVSLTVNGGGLVNAASVCCNSSGSAGHITTIADGGTLNFTSGDWGSIGHSYNTYIFGPASTVEFSGNALQNVSAPAPYGNLLIAGQGEKTSGQGELTVEGNLEIQSCSSLSVPQGSSLTIQGNLVTGNADGLILKGGCPGSAPASMICYGTAVGTGTVRMEKYITGYLTAGDANYHLVSSPVTDQPIQPGFVTEPPDSASDFYRWDEPLGQWINSKTSSGSWNTSFQPGDDRKFKTGRAYLLAYPSDVVRIFSGPVLTSDVTVPVSFTPGSYEGYNLAGNPFTSAIIADIPSWTKTGIMNAVWVWDAVSGNYRTWNGLTGTLDGGIIPATQGFFIRATGPSPSLLIPASSRVHSTQNPYAPAGKAAGDSSAGPVILKLSLTGSGYMDESVLYIPRPAAIIPDSLFNVNKMIGFEDAPQLYFTGNQRRYSVLQEDSLGGGTLVPLGIHRGISDTLRFEFGGAETFAPGDIFYLEDRLEGRMIDLRDTRSYVFTCSRAKEDDRFFIRYRNTTGVTNPASPATVGLHAEKDWLVFRVPEDFMGCEHLSVFDMSGRLMLDQVIPPGLKRLKPGLDPGCYLVRMTAGNSNVNAKVVLTK